MCRSNGKCAIKFDQRNMCRDCRFQKCLSVGMNKSHVQPNRDSVHCVRTEHSNTEESQPPRNSTLVKQETIVLNFPIKKELNLQVDRLEPPKLPVRNVLPLTTVRPQTAKFPLLERLLAGYRSYKETERSLYYVINPTKLNAHADPEPVTTKQFYEMDRGCLTLAHRMLLDFLSLFAALKNKTGHKLITKLLQSFYHAFSVLEATYQSSIIFPNPKDTRLSLHYRQYLDHADLSNFYGPEKHPQSQASLTSFLFTRSRRLVNQIGRLKPSEMEIAGMIGLILWNSLFSESMNHDDVANRKREEIHAELHQLYVETHGVGQAGVRLGTAFSLISESMEIARHAVDTVSMSRVFKFSEERKNDVWSKF
ncbi:hypothetical protein L596_015792 [Steinernema carpocapsae]|uniref:Nuclear receptor domain-containing protein n=1 Tax=Steinernema carpocapsae TaxID=34508 RepID=A0A4U5NG70_STECR|nr:hypothetical protein L596_015792 [Steinernema carpocapsae]